MSMKNGTDKHKGGGRDTGEGVVDHGGTGRLMGKLFWDFLKLGLFTIGGGMAMIPQMQRLASEDNRWLSREEVVDCIALSQSLPGIIAINMATYIGRRICGVRGAVAATTGVVLPSFVIILAAVLVMARIGGAFAICPALTESMIPGVARRAAANAALPAWRGSPCLSGRHGWSGRCSGSGAKTCAAICARGQSSGATIRPMPIRSPNGCRSGRRCRNRAAATFQRALRAKARSGFPSTARRRRSCWVMSR